MSISLEDELDALRKGAVTESPTRYVFFSLHQEGVSHMVDLESNNLQGECSCQHYQYRIFPLITQGIISLSSEKARCKHIRVARQIFYDVIIDRYAELTKSKSDTPDPY